MSGDHSEAEVEKSPDAFRTISEVAEDLDIPQHVLRFWETRFTQIKPLKRGGGRRYYRPDDVDLLKGIRRLLYGEGYTIKGVQRILKEQGARHVIAIGRGAPIIGQGKAEDAPPPQAAIPAIRAAEPPVALARPQPAEAPRPQPVHARPAIGESGIARLKAALFELGEAKDRLAGLGLGRPAADA